MLNFNYVEIEEIAIRVLKIIKAGDICEDYVYADGPEPCLHEKLRDAITSLHEETVKKQKQYRLENFLPEFPPASELSLDFLRSNIDDSVTTSGKVDILRGDIYDFMQMVAWISCERNTTTELCSLVRYLNTCDYYLKKYSNNIVPSHFIERRQNVKQVVSVWRKSFGSFCSDDETNIDISCRNDAILVQLLKFCGAMSEVIAKFPETATIL